MTGSPLRVLLVLNSLGAGGTERSTALLLPGLRAAGIEPIVACFVRREEGDQQAVIDAGFDVRFVEGGWLARIRGLRRLIGEVRPAVVHTAIFEADVAGRVAAAGTGIPVMSSLVNTPYDQARYSDPRVTPWKLRVVQVVDSLTGRLLATRFHAVTVGVARDAVENLRFRPSRIRVVERGRDLTELGEPSASRRLTVRRRLGLQPDVPVVVAVGRVEYQKAHGALVEALARLSSSRPDMVLLIAGRDGNASGELAAAVERNQLDGRVQVLGHRSDVPDLLAAADVFAMPSLYEGTAGAAIEALALGVPVVATGLAGTEGLLVDGLNARLVPAGSVDELAAAIEVATSDADGRNAALTDAGRRAVQERFTLDRAVDEMASLYREVARARPVVPALGRARHR